MGIYIKGMELPSCCDKCPFKKYIGSDLLKCRITGYRFYAFDVGWGDKPYTRHESCPLIEIPPHGRLIDADEIPYNKIMLDDDEFYYGVTQPYIDRMQTIIEAEPPSGCEDCKYWDGERCANSNGKDCHNSILWWPKEGRE